MTIASNSSAASASPSTAAANDTARVPGRAPSHAVYHVRDIAGRDKSFWTRVGSAWAHNDGQGFSVQLECTPIDGRLSLRVIADARE